MYDPSCKKQRGEFQAFEASLRRLELDRVLGSDIPPEARDRMPVWGLALSGGGIRSATYCLGVLQALSKRGMLGAFHYCSTVSGGGYAGGFLQAMLDKHKDAEDPIRNVTDNLLGSRLEDVAGPAPRMGHLESSAASSAIKKLRSYSNFLSPNKRPLSGDRIALVATYLSNMLLTQLQLGALILFLVFVPYLAVAVLQWMSSAPLLAWFLAVVAIVIALAARPRRSVAAANGRPERSGPFPFTGASIIPPAGLSLAFILLAGLIWPVHADLRPPSGNASIQQTMQNLSSILGHKFEEPDRWFAPLAIASAYLIGFVTWLLWWMREARKEDNFGNRLAHQLIFGSLACIAFGAVTYVLQQCKISDVLEQAALPHRWPEADAELSRSFVTVAVGSPVLFSVFFTINLLHLALAYDRADIVSRERWNRLMGRTAVWVFGGVCGGLLVTHLVPAILANLTAGAEGGMTVPTVLAALWGCISVGGAIFGYWEQMSRAARGLSALLKRVVLALALWVFLGGIVIAMGLIVLCLMHRAGAASGLVPWNALLWGLIPLVSWYLLARFVDENEFSMNGFYRNRLVRCYLAARNSGDIERDVETGLNPKADDIPLPQLRRFQEESTAQRPLYPLICGAVNLVRSGRLEWQDRKAASFVFSPLFCGHQPLGDGQTGPIGDTLELPNLVRGQCAVKKSDVAKQHTLGAAMAVSGAAVSSNMGYHSSPAVSALLTLFNVRLGWWVENKNAEDSVLDFAGLNLLSELLSNTHENGKYVYVTDGGHFENLGIYELVRRRCRFILAVDATADHMRGFGDLANAVHKCRVDFGAEVDIDTSLMQKPGQNGFVSRCAALGRITYDDGSEGLLLYLKPSLIGDESADIRTYANLHDRFPHEPTSDQFFDEIQFECYRQLGFQNMLAVIERVALPQRAKSRPITGVTPEANEVREIGMTLLDQAAKEEFLKRLKYRLYEPSDAVSLKRSQHSDALTRLLDRLRDADVLKFLDTQLYPGLHRYTPPASAQQQQRILNMGLPGHVEFRDCFYYMQELIQLMESVHTDLDLERNWNHPDNRGWMNLFQHWSWVPIFRLTWALTLQTRGSRFVHFCERRLEIPRINQYIRLERVFEVSRKRKRNVSPMRWMLLLKNVAERQYKYGRINFLERSLLQSRAVRLAVRHADAYWLGVASIRMEAFLRQGGATHDRADELPVGIVLLTRAGNGPNQRWSIEILRVQDHLRRMGVGLAIVRRLVCNFKTGFEPVRTVSGYCGRVLGKVSDINAAKHDKRITRFINQIK